MNFSLYTSQYINIVAIYKWQYINKINYWCIYKWVIVAKYISREQPAWLSCAIYDEAEQR